MSKVKVVNPVVHTPSFTKYQINRIALKGKLHQLKLEIPMGMLDNNYFFTDDEGWTKILFDMAFKSNLYLEDSFDCDNFALKAMSVCAERYGLNTLNFVIGDTPMGRHAFNILYTGEDFLLWEPNDGFAWSGQAFEIGDNGYKPELVLV